MKQNQVNTTINLSEILGIWSFLSVVLIDINTYL